MFLPWPKEKHHPTPNTRPSGNGTAVSAAPPNSKASRRKPSSHGSLSTRFWCVAAGLKKCLKDTKNGWAWLGKNPYTSAFLFKKFGCDMKPDSDDSKRQLDYTILSPGSIFRYQPFVLEGTKHVSHFLSHLGSPSIQPYGPYVSFRLVIDNNWVRPSKQLAQDQVTATATERRALAPVLRSRQLEQRKMTNLFDECVCVCVQNDAEIEISTLKVSHYKVPHHSWRQNIYEMYQDKKYAINCTHIYIIIYIMYI